MDLKKAHMDILASVPCYRGMSDSMVKLFYSKYSAHLNG